LKNYSWAKAFFHRYGKKSIFFARLLGPLAWVTPFIAGAFNIKYKDFIRYNIPGLIIGIGEFMIAGYFFGFAYIIFLGKIQKYILIVLLVIVAAVLYLIDKEFRLIDRAKKHIMKRIF
jgi:membrane protein DedA with SNARE-associated domain